jgi:Cytochrome P460
MKRPSSIRLSTCWLVLVVAATTAEALGSSAVAATEWSTDGAQRTATVSIEAGPAYESDGRLRFPANYREWIFLSTGLDMSYGDAPQDHSMFDNVFVEPTAYREFVRTGRWPDGTSLVLEVRAAAEKGSINQHGKYQAGEIMGMEVHVKDTKRFQGGWAFFSFSGPQPARMLPMSEDCYSCHEQHAAVDTTFVQFYPTLLPIATLKGTLSPGYKP